MRGFFLYNISVKIKDGLIEGVRFIQSPNCDARPNHCEPSLIVIHCISLPPGLYGGSYVTQLFTNTLNPDEHPYFQEIYNLQVSAHIFIRRDGDILQYVPFHERAWHAGESNFDGRHNCNDFSIGIELEGTDSTEYELKQYKILAEIICLLFGSYKDLSANKIVGHQDISQGRKTDPGQCFNWEKLHSFINSQKDVN